MLPASSSILVPGSLPVARLTPLKRILCLCPVVLVGDTNVARAKNPQQSYYDRKKIGVECQVGIAISDPYLSRAERVDGQKKPMMIHLKWPQQPQEKIHGSVVAMVSNSFPDNAAAFLDEIGHSDVGGILLALPMKSTATTTDHPKSPPMDKTCDNNETLCLEAACDFIQSSILSNYLKQDPHFAGKGLMCETKDRMFLQDAISLAREDPEMFEEVDLLGDNNNDEDDEDYFNRHRSDFTTIEPNVHAGVALNRFLWHHTGGWQNNTFG